MFANGNAALRVVATERRTDDGRFRKSRNDLFYHFPILIIVNTHGLQSGTQGFRLFQYGLHLRRGEIGEFAVSHLFQFTFHKVCLSVYGSLLRQKYRKDSESIRFVPNNSDICGEKR